MWLLRTVVCCWTMLHVTIVCGTLDVVNYDDDGIYPEYVQSPDSESSHADILDSILDRMKTYYDAGRIGDSASYPLYDDVNTNAMTTLDKRADDGEYVMGFWIPKKRGLPLFGQKSFTKRAKSPYTEPRGFLFNNQEYVDKLDKRLSGSSSKEKRYNSNRYMRRGSCDFTRLTTQHILEYLRSGLMCGRRVSNIRFGLTGRK